MGIDSNNRAGGGAAYSRFAEEMDIDSVDLTVNGSPSKVEGLKSLCFNHWKVIIMLLIGLLSFGIGIILGHFIAAGCLVDSSTNGMHHNGTSPSPSSGPTVASPTPAPSPDYLQKIKGLISREHLQYNLNQFTTGPHQAGSPGNLKMADTINNLWSSYGFSVEKKNYRVLLSRPNRASPNKLVIYDTTTQTDYLNLSPTELLPSGMLPAFAVYGTNASLTSKPVYVNFATTDDFNQLQSRTSIHVENCTCIARLGKIPLAQMAQISADRKCLGLIAFRDRKPYGDPSEAEHPSNFPSTWWLPIDGVPRETARLSMGDPSSPFFPSHDWMPRQSPSSLLEGFPVQTISYDSAKGLLRMLKNPPASDPLWQGGLPVYNLGPGFHETKYVLKFEVNNQLQMDGITNVLATIQGTVEPDRYVIIGNHRDSLSYGVVSPGTGTACLMEVSRILSELMKQGWSPRRTIILASWDAGEDGSIGSTEWIEENMEKLRSRGIAYINLDDAVSGNYSFAAAGSPLLSKVIFQATMDVKCPNHGDMSLHHNWAARRPSGAGDNQPRVDPLGSSSDAGPFLMLAGVPSVDLHYTYDEDYYNVSSYPTYRTAYDKSQNIKTFIDPEFLIHAAVTEVAARTLVTLADTPKLSMGVVHYASSLTAYAQQFRDKYGTLLTQQGISLDLLEYAVSNFSTAAQSFQAEFDAIDENNELLLREMNDHISSVERAFLFYQGTPFNPESRHLIFSASVDSAYKGAAFGPIAQVIVMERELGNWLAVEQALGYTVFSLQAATAILHDAHLH